MTPKTKNTLILLGILIILIIILVFWQNSFEAQQNKIEKETIITNDLENLQKIEINQADKTIILTKQDSDWLITSEENVLANKILIENLIEGLKKTKSGTIISSSQSKLADFNLTEDTATQLKLYNNQANLIIELLIGKRGGPAYDQTYIKKINSNNILITEENLTSLVNQPDWKEPIAEEENDEATTEAIPLELNQNN